MHIVDGALAPEVLIVGAVATVAGTVIGLRKMDVEAIPVAGVLSAMFFVASLIHVPLGITSVHLIMNGLAGIVLGWMAFPALLVGLTLQAVFFGFGGLTVLGVNAVNIALPAVIIGVLCRGMLARGGRSRALIFGGIAGAGSIFLTAVMVALSLALSGDAFIPAAKLVIISHIPIMVIEGILTAAACALVVRVKPELFRGMA